MNKNYLLLFAFLCFFKFNAQQAGDLDTSFGTNGTLRLNLWNATFNVKSHVVLPDGKTILAGEINNQFSEEGFLVKLLANGAIDLTFGDEGKSVHPFLEGFNVVKLQSDGKILVGSQYENNYAVARYLPNGELDPSFGYDGTYYDINSNSAPNSPNPVKDIEIQTDNKIVVLTSADLEGVKNFAILRLNSNGILDTSLNIADYFNTGDIPVALSIQPDGKFVMTGYNSTNASIFVLRYNSNGTLDNSFNTTGFRLFTITNALFTVIKDLQLQTDGKILFCGSYYLNGNSLLAIFRLNSNGTFDSTFSGNGLQSVMVDVNNNTLGKIAIQSDGKILQMDTFYDQTDGNEDMLVIRYNVDGELDSTFNDGSAGLQLDLNNLKDKAACISVFNNKLIISGNTELSVIDNSIALAKFDLDPLLFDDSFGDEGIAQHSIPFPTDEQLIKSVVQSDNKIVALAQMYVNNAPFYCIERFNEDGTLDNTFGSNGRLGLGFQITDFHGLAVDSQNRIVVSGYTSLTGGLILRITPQGTLDNTFGNQGITYLVDDINFLPIFNSIKFQPDGKIILAGTSAVNNIEDFLLLRLNSNGTLDNSFGTGGISQNGSTNLDESIFSIEILDDGKIIALGFTEQNSGNLQASILKFNSIGLLDPTFNGNGKFDTNVNVPYYAKGDVKIQSDGKILCTFESELNNFILYRLNSNGTADNTFGFDGNVDVFISGSDISTQIYFDEADQKITLIGTSSINEIGNFTLVRFLSNGDVDSDFGNFGLVTTEFGHTVQAISASQTSNGRLIVSGLLYDEEADDLDQVFAKYHLNETLNVLNPEILQIQVYPNPVEEKLFVSFKNETEYSNQYFITDITGKIIKRGKLVLEQGVNVSNLNNGIYFLTIDDFNPIKFIKK